jgi:hypothetical protein
MLRVTLFILALTLFVACPMAHGYTRIFVQYYLEEKVRPKDRILVYVLCFSMFVVSIFFASLLAMSDDMSLAKRDRLAVRTFLLSIIPVLVAVRVALGPMPPKP